MPRPPKAETAAKDSFAANLGIEANDWDVSDKVAGLDCALAKPPFNNADSFR